MYWMIREDGGYEVLDGQQRTISIGEYVNGDFSLNDRFFHNLTDFYALWSLPQGFLPCSPDALRSLPQGGVHN